MLEQGVNRHVADHLPTYSGDGLPEQTLTLTNVSHLDAGFYSCQASNVLGDAESNYSIQLLVKCKWYVSTSYVFICSTYLVTKKCKIKYWKSVAYSP